MGWGLTGAALPTEEPAGESGSPVLSCRAAGHSELPVWPSGLSQKGDTSINCSSRLRKRSAPPFHSTEQSRLSRTQRLNEKIELFHPLVPNRALSPKWLCTVPVRLHNEILAACYVNPLIPVRAS